MLPLSETARERLRQVLIQQSGRTGSVAEAAILARVDAAIAIATAEAVFTLLRRKNLIGTEELDRALADSYGDAADFLANTGVLAVPGTTFKN